MGAVVQIRLYGALEDSDHGVIARLSFLISIITNSFASIFMSQKLLVDKLNQTKTLRLQSQKEFGVGSHNQ
jgi:hypothetical protein